LDNWTVIILEAEENWKELVASENILCFDKNIYKVIRDEYKAKFILREYGFECFQKFVERCPHIKDSIKKYALCLKNGQCNMECIFYGNGGCKYATE
jgi:hypothetical protein